MSSMGQPASFGIIPGTSIPSDKSEETESLARTHPASRWTSAFATEVTLGEKRRFCAPTPAGHCNRDPGRQGLCLVDDTPELLRKRQHAHGANLGQRDFSRLFKTGKPLLGEPHQLIPKCVRLRHSSSQGLWLFLHGLGGAQPSRCSSSQFPVTGTAGRGASPPHEQPQHHHHKAGTRGTRRCPGRRPRRPTRLPSAAEPRLRRRERRLPLEAGRARRVREAVPGCAPPAGASMESQAGRGVGWARGTASGTPVPRQGQGPGAASPRAVGTPRFLLCLYLVGFLVSANVGVWDFGPCGTFSPYLLWECCGGMRSSAEAGNSSSSVASLGT